MVEAKDTYESYEVTMYGDKKNLMVYAADGKLRGRPENFDLANFDKLTDDEKNTDCQVPFSQPAFFMALLLVWALVCFSEIRTTLELGSNLLINTQTVASMKEAVVES